MAQINIAELSPQVDTAFTVADNTFAHIKQPDTARSIEIEVGDKKQPGIAYPQFKTKHWDNECNFSLRLIDDDYMVATIQTVADKIEWERAGRKARFYELATGGEDGGFEFEVEFAAKPTSNVIEFSVQSKGFRFEYQPPLTQGEIDRGAIRPANVEKSYAVYHKTKKNNTIGGKHYRAGKAFHIYRAHAVDASENEVWCDLFYNDSTSTLTVTVPQAFLDTAVYPVIVDPTFGYTTAGASSTPLFANAVGSNFTNSAGAGTGDKLTASVDGTIATEDMKAAIYEGRTSDALVTNGTTAEVIDVANGQHWQDFTFPTAPTIADATEYQPMVRGVGGQIYYDSASSGQYALIDPVTYASAWPDPLAPTEYDGLIVSIYCTFTAAGGTALVVQDIFQSQSIDNISLTQHSALSVGDIAQSQAIDNIDLIQHGDLLVGDLIQPQTIDNVILSISTQLVAQDSTQAQTIDNVSLVQHNSLLVSDLEQSQTIDNVLLTQHNILIISDVLQAQILDTPSLTQHGIIAVNNVNQDQVIDSVSITQHNSLAVDQIDQEQSIDIFALLQHNILAIQNIIQSQQIDNIILAVAGTLNVQDSDQSQTIDSLSLTQHSAIIINDIEQIQNIEDITLTQHNSLSVDGIDQTQTLMNVTLLQHNILFISDILQTQDLENIALAQHGTLIVAGVDQVQNIDSVTLASHNILVVSDIEQIQTVQNVNIGSLFGEIGGVIVIAAPIDGGIVISIPIDGLIDVDSSV